MGLGRRSFLKAFGALPLAPAAAKEALASTGMSGLGIGSTLAEIGAVQQAATIADDGSKVANWILANGVPDFVLEAMRRDMQAPNGLDPDLAANRSFSLVTKVRLQQERDVQRRCRLFANRQRTNLARAAFRKATGLEFWW